MLVLLAAFAIAPVLAQQKEVTIGYQDMVVPYRMAQDIRGIGFKTADDIAYRLGVANDAPERLKAGLLHVLETAAQNGHCCFPEAKTAEKAIELLGRPGTYERLEQLGRRLADGLAQAALDAGAKICVNQLGSMATMFFAAGPITNYADAKTADTARFATFFQAMRNSGVFLPPSQFEAMFVSLAHTEADIDRVIAASRAALSAATSH